MSRPIPILLIKSIDELRAANRALYDLGYHVYDHDSVESINRAIDNEVLISGAFRVCCLYVDGATIFYTRDRDTRWYVPSTYVNSLPHLLTYLRRTKDQS